MTYVITEPCIGTKDGSCVEVCPVDCIYEGEDQFYIHPDECIDCGACEPACPTKAIFAEESLPEKWREYVALNAELSRRWPNVSEKKEPLPEAERWKDVEEKRQFLEGA